MPSAHNIDLEADHDVASLATDLHVRATYRLTEALVASENRMRRRIELLSEIVFETDREGTLIFLNGAWTKSLGFPVDPCIGELLSKFVREEDRALFEAIIHGSASTVSSGRPQLRFPRLGGGCAWMEISVATLTEGGVVGTLHDITSEKLAQDEITKLSLVASSTENLVIIADRYGCTEWVNEAFTRRTGYTLEEMKGKKPGQLLQGPKSDLATVAKIRNALNEGHSLKADLINYTRSGEAYWVDLQLTPIRNAAGCVERFVSVQTDSTDLRRTQTELESAKERAERMAAEALAATQAKSDFLATMSHEIRTPMNGILGMTELLLQTHLTPQQVELTRSVSDCGQALLRIINDILDFSRIEAGQLKLVAEPFEPKTLVTDIVSLLSRSNHGKSVRLDASFDSSVPVQLRGDAGRLRQVLLNLMGNGLKFTTAGSVVTRVHSPQRCPGTAWIRFDVTDTGIGIPVGKQRHLFQPFQQLDSSPTRHHGGTGLGLAISQRIVEMMGGHMGVESELGKGSTFWFEVPMALEEPPVRIAQVPSRTLPRVLIGRDHELSSRITQLLLQRLGCHADIVESEPALLGQLSTEAYDVVLFDWNLTGTDGGVLATRIRELITQRDPLVSNPVRVLVFESDLNLHDAMRLRECGIDAMVSASPTLTELRQVLFNPVCGSNSPPSTTHDPHQPRQQAGTLRAFNPIH